MDDLSQHYNQDRSGHYGENIKRGILDEAIGLINGTAKFGDLTSNLPDHSLAAHLTSATYISHIRRSQGLNPIVSMDLTYSGEISYLFITHLHPIEKDAL